MASIDILIRDAEPGDYPDLLPLFEQVDSLHRTQLPRQFQKPPGAPRNKDYYLSLLADPELSFLVAELEYRLVGFIHTVIQKTPPVEVIRPRVYAVIDGLVVKENQQRKGIGRKLVKAAQEWARSRGAEHMDLNVYAFNDQAIKFYRDIGFSALSHKFRKEFPPDQKTSSD